jgi:hypothetical protein
VRGRVLLLALGGLAFVGLSGGCGDAGPAEQAEAATSVVATTSAPPFRATLEAPTPTPEVGTRWSYTVTVVDRSGAPLKARITVEVVDPIQQAHPVDYDGTTEPIVDRPIDGEFSDYVIWPPDSRGIALTFRVTVKAMGMIERLPYRVTAQ